MSRLAPLMVLAVALLAPTSGKAEVKLLLGWIETVMLDPRLGLELDAKLDTGADTSSLDAHDIRRVRVGEKRYVRFSVRHPETGEWVELRKPYLRRVRIKRHHGDYQRRYVVRMQVCVGERTRSIEVNLIDRGQFDYPMLLGRSALAGWAVVDPDLEHLTRPGCWRKPGSEPDDDAPNPPDDDDLAPGDLPEADITAQTTRDASEPAPADSTGPDKADTPTTADMPAAGEDPAPAAVAGATVNARDDDPAPAGQREIDTETPTTRGAPDRAPTARPGAETTAEPAPDSEL